MAQAVFDGTALRSASSRQIFLMPLRRHDRRYWIQPAGPEEVEKVLFLKVSSHAAPASKMSNEVDPLTMLLLMVFALTVRKRTMPEPAPVIVFERTVLPLATARVTPRPPPLITLFRISFPVAPPPNITPSTVLLFIVLEVTELPVLRARKMQPPPPDDPFWSHWFPTNELLSECASTWNPNSLLLETLLPSNRLSLAPIMKTPKLFPVIVIPVTRTAEAPSIRIPVPTTPDAASRRLVMLPSWIRDPAPVEVTLTPIRGVIGVIAPGVML